MIRIYTGTPGSGKSLHSIRLICAYLQEGKSVIGNFPLKVNQVRKMKGRYFFLDNDQITTDLLMQYLRSFHEPEKENQTLIIIDEASVKFNSRTFNAKDRLKFCSFFSQHRKYGYNIVLVCQNMRQIDRQIRDQVELEVKHRKLNTYSFWRILPFPLFVAIERNVAINDKNDHEFFLYSRKYGEMYDTFFEFDSSITVESSPALLRQIEAAEIIHKNRSGTHKKEAGPCPTRAHGVVQPGPRSTDGVGPALDGKYARFRVNRAYITKNADLQKKRCSD
ncbi:MAG: zonular occludens toxin domain-containing protein [Bacteroidales bacterium]